MWKYLGKRLLQMLVTLLLFQIITYLLMDAQPGDIADLLTMNPDIPPAEAARLRADLGLDRPPLERMVHYIINFYQGDLGVSFQEYPTPVLDIIKERLPRTFVLFVTANTVAFWAGFVTGKILAWKRGGFVEYSSTIAGVTLYTVFLPWFALMMIWLFSVTLDWFPPGKFINPQKWLTVEVTTNEIFIRLIWTSLIGLVLMFVGFQVSNRVPRRYRLPIRLTSFLIPAAGVVAYWATSGVGELALDILSHLILPVGTLTLYAYAGTMLLMRTTMLETLREDYILTARAKGVPDKVVRDRHAARNALLPVWTGLVFGIVGSIGGGVITETVFSWPGIGRALLTASTQEDIPVAMGVLTILGVLTLVSHLIVDVGYAFLDPRIRYS
ncbi:MAG: ABC transporter permease [Anaerolineae bacterium]|jgi:peptide/nickel transport system permease protein